MLIRKVVINGILGILAPSFTVGGRCAAIVAGIIFGALWAVSSAALLAVNPVIAEPIRMTDIAYPAVAKPWRDVNLSFSRPGRVVKILVHRGQAVKAGQVLAEENDQQQKIADQLAKLSANSTLRIQAAQAELAQDTVSLNRTQLAAGKHAATPFEVRRAQLKVTIDKLSLTLAEVKHEHDLLDWQAAKLAVQRRNITAPFNGVIEDRFIDTGQSVNAFKNVLEIVQLNRLRIFVPVPLRVAIELQTGQPARVTPAAGALTVGKIIWIAKVADSASNTLLVEIRVDNTQHLPAGQRVQVTFLPRQVATALTTGRRGSGISRRQRFSLQPIGGGN